jgi:hypothetical protein
LRKSPLPAPILLWALAIFSMIPLVTHLVIGLGNRPLRDDYCLTLGAQTFGVLGNIRHYYDTWTGTYSSTFFQSMIGLAGLWRFTPFVLIILWFCTLLWTLYALYSLLLKNQPIFRHRFILSLATTSLLLAATVNGTSNVYQSVYWTSGAITYTLPLIVLTFNVGIAIRLLMRDASNPLPLQWLIGIGVLCLLAGGFSPLFAVSQVLLCLFLLGISALYLPAHYRHAAVQIMICASVCSILALLVLLIAPGNTIRHNSYNNSLTMDKEIILSAGLALKYLLGAPFIVLVLPVTSAIGGWLYMELNYRFKPIMLLFLSAMALLITLVMLMSNFFLTLFSMGKFPPPRAYIVMQYTTIWFAAIFGLSLGYGLAQYLRHSNRYKRFMRNWGFRLATVIILSAVSASLILMTYRTLYEGRLVTAFAAEWDMRAAQLAAAGRPDDIKLETFENFVYNYYRLVGIESLGTSPSPEICLDSPGANAAARLSVTNQ